MKLKFFVFSLLCSGGLAFAQIKEVGVDDESVVIESKPPSKDAIFTVAEVMPEYPGGSKKLKEFINAEFKYPKKARKDKIEGKVYVQFVVLEDGTLTEIQTIKGLSPELDAEACRVIEKTKKWTPGQQWGKPVKVRHVFPVECKLPVK